MSILRNNWVVKLEGIYLCWIFIWNIFKKFNSGTTILYDGFGESIVLSAIRSHNSILIKMFN